MSLNRGDGQILLAFLDPPHVVIVGGRLGRRDPDRSSPIDGVISLAMAVERAEAKPEPVRLLGWV